MIKFFETDNPLEAHFVRGLLEARGIAAKVTGEDMAMAPSVVWIFEADADRAVLAIATAKDGSRAPESLPDSPCPCPSCGEAMERQFVACWNCGYEVSPDE